MHGTRTTAKILVGAAVAALAGCVSVDAPPTAPVTAPAAETVRPARQVAPQIVEGPALDALEAALPAPPPPARPQGTPEQGAQRRATAPRPPEAPRPVAVPPRGRGPLPTAGPLPTRLPDLTGLPKVPPVSRDDLCALGERYGGWDARSGPTRICRGVPGR
ncbi:hypothetical protein ACGFYZ_22600 [Streptomyces sp. NPDC048330]|uniref:hypothetical protein n=1 Tax=Streptomyces sp. NPDC048330 TaxID=3365533 RepID=UPI0037207207